MLCVCVLCVQLHLFDGVLFWCVLSVCVLLCLVWCDGVGLLGMCCLCLSLWFVVSLLVVVCVCID